MWQWEAGTMEPSTSTNLCRLILTQSYLDSTWMYSTVQYHHLSHLTAPVFLSVCSEECGVGQFKVEFIYICWTEKLCFLLLSFLSYKSRTKKSKNKNDHCGQNKRVVLSHNVQLQIDVISFEGRIALMRGGTPVKFSRIWNSSFNFILWAKIKILFSLAFF